MRRPNLSYQLHVIESNVPRAVADALAAYERACTAVADAHAQTASGERACYVELDAAARADLDAARAARVAAFAAYESAVRAACAIKPSRNA